MKKILVFLLLLCPPLLLSAQGGSAAGSPQNGRAVNHASGVGPSDGVLAAVCLQSAKRQFQHDTGNNRAAGDCTGFGSPENGAFGCDSLH